MISTSYIGRYPLTGLSVELRRCIESVNEQREDKSAKPRSMAAALVSAFYDIQGEVLEQPFEIKRRAAEFIGFLLVETSTKFHRAKANMRNFLNTFEYAYDESIKSPDYPVEEECRRRYKALQKDKARIRYYYGWPFKYLDGKSGHLDLIDFYNVFGEELTSKYAKCISLFLGRYRSTSGMQHQTMLKKFVGYISSGFKDAHELALLNDPIEVNIFFESMYWVFQKQQVELGKDESAFDARWANLARTVRDSLIDGGLIAQPTYDLFAPKFKTPIAERNGRENKIVNKCVKLLTRFPTQSSDSEIAEDFFNQIFEDVNFIGSTCNEVCEELLALGRSRKKFSLKNGEGCLGKTTYYEEACQFWSENNYRAGASDYRKFKKDLSALSQELGLYKVSDLIPFLYRLVILHPSITPAWLLSLEVYDDLHRPVGYETTSQRLVGEKARRGVYYAQQEVLLTDQSKKIIEQIIELTSEAREYLRLTNNDDYRFLLIAPSTPYGKPRKVQKIGAMKDDAYANSKLILKMRGGLAGKSQEYIEQVISAASLPTVRASCGVMVYLKTKSVREMSEALGHQKYSPDLIARYLPRWLHEYFLNRWIRIYQNSLIYLAMKESGYLLEAMDFKTIEEVSKFMHEHGLRLETFMPQEQQCRWESTADTRKFEQGSVVVSVETCDFLLAYKEAYERVVSQGIERDGAFSEWYVVSAFVAGARSLVLETDNNEFSAEVIAVLKKSRSRPNLISKLFETIICG